MHGICLIWPLNLFEFIHLLSFSCPLLQLIFEETRQLPCKFYTVVAFSMCLCPLNLLEMVIRSRGMIKFTFIFLSVTYLITVLHITTHYSPIFFLKLKYG